MTERIRVTVIGAGRYARMGLLPALLARPDVEVTAIVFVIGDVAWVSRLFQES